VRLRLLETTPPTAAKAVALLESLGVLRESSGRKRDRMFSYERYLELLSSGMERVLASLSKLFRDFLSFFESSAKHFETFASLIESFLTLFELAKSFLRHPMNDARHAKRLTEAAMSFTKSLESFAESVVSLAESSMSFEKFRKRLAKLSMSAPTSCGRFLSSFGSLVTGATSRRHRDRRY
jgi:hypothetical protein